MLRVFLALQYLVASTSLASQIITYPNQSYSDSYPVKLLELALSKACYQHGLIPQKSALEIHQGVSPKTAAGQKRHKRLLEHDVQNS